MLPRLTGWFVSVRRGAATQRGFVGKLIVVAFVATLAEPAVAQNLLERSGAAPAYEEREPSPPVFSPPRPRPAPGAAALPPPPVLPAPGQPAQPGAAPAGPAAPQPAPPYEPQLLRLSELLGALTYLQNLCGGQSGQIWRDKMTALMDAETQDETRRERLAGAYNRGFKGYELNYRQCTANAQVIITRFLNESARIARDVTRRYGTS